MSRKGLGRGLSHDLQSCAQAPRDGQSPIADRFFSAVLLRHRAEKRMSRHTASYREGHETDLRTHTRSNGECVDGGSPKSERRSQDVDQDICRD